MMGDEGFNGKKVFFLFPHSVLQENMINELIYNEYEVYLLKNIDHALRLINKFNDSLLFVNIDEGQKEPEWEKFIREIRTNPKTQNIGIGILSYNNNQALIQKYLIDIGIQCGYIQLKIGVEESTKIILKVLAANEAKGKRKYVRGNCSEKAPASFNVMINGNLYAGRVFDISSIGMACAFDKEPNLVKNQILPKLQLKLKSMLVMVTGIVFGFREDNGKTYVLLFDPSMDGKSHANIRKFISMALQAAIEEELGK